jgi:hypothetical protein
MDTFRELLEISQRNRKGLTFYVGGLTIPGYVLRVLDAGGATEVANQTQSRVIIRLERVDGVAMT